MNWLLARLSEVSTYLGALGLAAGAVAKADPASQPYAGYLAMMCAGLMIVISERGSKSPEQIAADALAAAQAARPGMPPA